MSFDDYMYEGFDDVEPSSGYTGEPLPSGWYPARIEKVLETRISRNGAPQARLQLLVTEGEHKDSRAFVSVTMGPSRFDKDGAERTPDEVKKAAKNIQPQMAGLLRAIGVKTGHPAGANDIERVCSFFGIGQWDSREFMAYLKYMQATDQFNASNRLNGYYSLDDEKKGLEAWRKQHAAPEPTSQTI